MKRLTAICVAAAVALCSLSAMAKGPKEVKTVVYKVSLHCEGCVKKVTENVGLEKGVKMLKCSLEDSTVTIDYDSAKTTEEALRKSLEKLGYKVDASGCADCGGEECHDGECHDGSCKDGEHSHGGQETCC